MKIPTYCLALVLASTLKGDKDYWLGDEYAKHSESQRASAEDFMQFTSFDGTESILDVGCGDGKITAAMAEKVPLGSVIGVDISPSMIDTANNTFSKRSNLSFCVTDAVKVEYDKKFDLITSFTVMQWVLDQTTALKQFEKALKPKGKLWVQIPTGLPKAMETALEKTISSPEWSSHFIHFSPPWRFYQPEEYTELLSQAHLTQTRVQVTKKHEMFPSRGHFHGFLKQWFPYLRPLPSDQKDLFLTQLLDNYLALLPSDAQGRVSFIVDRLEVEAIKSSR